MDYVKLAISKNVLSRGIMQYPYRMKTALVATDGYRLHMLNGLPEAEPVSLSPDYYGEKFPDISQVLDDPQTSVEIGIKDYLGLAKELKPVQSFLSKYDKSSQPVTISFDLDKSVVFTARNSRVNLQVKYPATNIANAELIEPVTFNLKYFLDAITYPKSTFRPTCELDLPIGESSQIRFRRGNYLAVVMKMKDE